jgi:hypothetical protein
MPKFIYDKEFMIIANKIFELKSKLKQTDYIAIKYAEGLVSDEDYAPIKSQRQSWRDEINALEAELQNLK